MNTLSKIFSPMWESKKVRSTIFRAMIRPFMEWVIAIATVELMKRIVDWIEQAIYTEIIPYFLVFIWIILFTIILRYITRHWWYGKIRPIWFQFLSDKYIRKYTYADNTEMDKLGTWRSQHIISTGIKSWLNILWEMSISLMRNASKIIFSIILVFNINRLYGVIYITITTFILWIYIYSQNKANIYRRLRKTILIAYERDFVRLIMSKFEVLQNWRINDEINKQARYFKEWEENNMHIDSRRTVGGISSVFTIQWLRVLAISAIIYWLFWSAISLSEFVALLLIIGMLWTSVQDISNLYVNNTKELINVEKLWDLFDEIPQLQWYDSWKKFHFNTWNIELKNISFSYTEKWADVLSDLSLTFQWWNKIALVWPSWSGKSTLVKLIAGYIRPDSWSIIIDWQDLSDVSLKSYYQHIWYLTQEPSVFDGTIRENLLYGVDVAVIPKRWNTKSCLESTRVLEDNYLTNDSLTMDSCLRRNDNLNDKLQEAIRLSKCEFIYDLPHWLDTEIGERGVRLSGWQRQRLAIAKIFLKNPKIIILDEPTSALDSFSEEAISQAMNELFKWRTVLIIAHRLQTVKHADDIILLDNWLVAERGTHNELVKQWGQYAKMLELQSGF
jgi:ABC-type multidrug transport system fused ATPase/permease subunit